MLPPIDWLCPYALAVRDRASGDQPAWLPSLDMTAKSTQTVLQQLFRTHGARLVLKMENGSALRADELGKFLDEKNVFALFSPPQRPSYNGAIEASIGPLKTRTQKHADMGSAPTIWTTADLQAAVDAANRSRLQGFTPDHAWAERTDITASERAAFELAVARERLAARGEQQIALDLELNHWQGSAIDRVAISRALVGRGYL